jgi:hypothetical protein
MVTPKGAVLLLLVAAELHSASFTDAHQRAANRRRRIVVQLDAADHRRIQATPQEWLHYLFAYTDQPGSQIDSIVLDMGLDNDSAVYPSKVLPPTPDRWVKAWQQQGFEWVGALVRECRKRNIEVIWNHRFSEVDLTPDGKNDMTQLHPLKAEHPDWLLRSWWWQGLWNAASPGVRQMKVNILRELAENYELDGIQIDFARHVPALPTGHQWENRDAASEFLRILRRALLEVETSRGRPVLLSVKVPQTIEGAHLDGFDIETWSKERLVDLLTLGSRSMDVDFDAYRLATAGAGVKLMPCFDDHHTTDGYRYGSIEFLRGVYSSWWQQGASSVVTFNWGVAPPEWETRVGDVVSPSTHGFAYQQIGSPDTMRGRSKVFAVERRGGYPWAEGFFNRNDTAPLPQVLANDGRISHFTIRQSDDLHAFPAAEATLRLVLFRAEADDRLEVKLNGTLLPGPHRDPNWKDPQIFSPDPQPSSGGSGDFKINPKQKLLLFTYKLDQKLLRTGANLVEARVQSRGVYAPASSLQLEKLELAINY